MKMKKLLALALCLCMVLALTACGEKEATYKLGMGIAVSMDSSAENNAQVDATVAAVVTDVNGKIVACRLDVAQNKMNVADGAVDTAKTFQTKMELGSDYGMAGNPYSSDNNGDGKVLEWNEQAKAFESYVVGKTAEEIEAMTTQDANGHQISTDEALLSAGCTIQINDFKTAVVKACRDEQGMEFKAGKDFTLGVAAKTTAAESTAATADQDGVVKMYTDFAAAVMVNGKIVAALNDAIQPNITIGTKGEIVDTAFKATKRELKEEYGMSGSAYASDNNGDGKVLEWYEQSAAFSKYAVGKTADEIANMKTQEAEGHVISADEALLSAGCTIQISSICATVAQAANNAR
ncbi:MAG: hypothetical protein SOT64_07750 [Candidatus Faecousia sp.]|nr:hypothetical protein [Clostridiales bacterium]MDD6297102.1 hypothetical protein [Bacillota bacterium]MDD7341602.1 hypothetical protein [Bacillota bacterium]MDY2810490.1 hypothetical protein [Candidatus Faecousia sp.]